MTKHSESDNFEEWLEAYTAGHPRIYGDGNPSEFTHSDMFAAWVGGAIFTCNRMFNPSRPHVPPLPDIFQAVQDIPDEQ